MGVETVLALQRIEQAIIDHFSLCDGTPLMCSSNIDGRVDCVASSWTASLEAARRISIFVSHLND